MIQWNELWWIKGLQENTRSKFYMALTIRKRRTIKVGKSQDKLMLRRTRYIMNMVLEMKSKDNDQVLT